MNKLKEKLKLQLEIAKLKAQIFKEQHPDLAAAGSLIMKGGKQVMQNVNDNFNAEPVKPKRRRRKPTVA